MKDLNMAKAPRCKWHHRQVRTHSDLELDLFLSTPMTLPSKEKRQGQGIEFLSINQEFVCLNYPSVSGKALCFSFWIWEKQNYIQRRVEWQKSLLNEKWLKNPDMFCNQKRNLAEDDRAARNMRRKRESVFSNAPGGRAKTNAELLSILKGALWG